MTTLKTRLPSSRSFRTIARAVMAVGTVTTTALLGACATSPDSSYYTLAAPGGVPTTASLPAATVSGSPLLIELQPVNVPNQVSRPQIVLTSPSGDVKIEDFHRWASTLGDEVNAALSQQLTRTLGAIDTYRTPRPQGATVYRITVNVQRFESIRGKSASVDAVWSVIRSGDNLTMTCRSAVSEPVSDGDFTSLAAAHRKVIGTISDQIAAGIRAEQSQPRRPAASSSAASGAHAQVALPPPMPSMTCPSSGT